MHSRRYSSRSIVRIDNKQMKIEEFFFDVIYMCTAWNRNSEIEITKNSQFCPTEIFFSQIVSRFSILYAAIIINYCMHRRQSPSFAIIRNSDAIEFDPTWIRSNIKCRQKLKCSIVGRWNFGSEWQAAAVEPVKYRIIFINHFIYCNKWIFFAIREWVRDCICVVRSQYCIRIFKIS